MLTVTGGQREPWQRSTVSQCVSGCHQGQGSRGTGVGGQWSPEEWGANKGVREGKGVEGD